MAKPGTTQKRGKSRKPAAAPRVQLNEPKAAKYAARGARRAGRVRKEFWLPPAKLDEARRILGTDTDVETVEAALDLVVFRDEVRQGIQALGGLGLSRID